jgi:hypothetical protein
MHALRARKVQFFLENVHLNSTATSNGVAPLLFAAIMGMRRACAIPSFGPSMTITPLPCRAPSQRITPGYRGYGASGPTTNGGSLNRTGPSLRTSARPVMRRVSDAGP